jgi:predicted nucleic-acid-binding Zn-ribbon protein
MPELPITAKGYSGEVTLDKDKVKITRNGLFAKLSFWGTKKNDILLEDLESVYLKNSNLSTNGYIRFSRSQKAKSRVGLLAGIYDKNMVTFWRSQEDFEKLVDSLTELTDVKVESPKEKLPDSNTEYKRTCKECGKIWHVSKEEIEELKQNKKQNSIAGALTALTGNLAASAQANRNKSSQKNRLKELNSCPNCNSQNYEEKKIQF